MPVNDPNEFMDIIMMSQQKRIFKFNGVNKTSSRSHHVFQIRIQTFDNKSNPCQSFLNIVDLAGSERRSQLDQVTQLEVNLNDKSKIQNKRTRSRRSSTKYSHQGSPPNNDYDTQSKKIGVSEFYSNRSSRRTHAYSYYNKERPPIL